MNRKHLFFCGFFLLSSISTLCLAMEFCLAKDVLSRGIGRVMANKSDKEFIAIPFERVNCLIVKIFVKENGTVFSNWNNFIPTPLGVGISKSLRCQIYSPQSRNLWGFWDSQLDSKPKINKTGQYYVIGNMKILLNEANKKWVFKRSNILHVNFQDGRILEATESKKESLPKKVSSAIEREIARISQDEALQN